MFKTFKTINMNKVLNFLMVSVLLVSVIAIGSCRKDFDNPPADADLGIVANTTIKQLKAMHVEGRYEQITTDMIISGLVIANDKSGNLYKEIYIQDATGGIALQLDAVSLFNQFPVGRRVFLKLNGLWMSDYGRMIQIGAIDRSIPNNPQLTGIPSTTVGKYLIGGSLNNPVVPTKVNPADLTTNMTDPLLGTLIQMDDFEVVLGDTKLTWADTSSAKNSRDLNVIDCSGNRLIIRSSGYSNFAGVKVPKGKGSVTAVYTIFRTTKQLLIRDTSDAPLHGVRCNGTTLPEGDAPIISIADLRALHTGSDVNIEYNRIKGIVISDSKNIGAGNIVLQDGNSGIDLFFGTSAAGALAAFKVGDSLVVDISGGSLEEYNGMLEVVLPSAAVPAVAAGTAATGSGTSVVPVTRTIAEIATNMATIENTLVKIVNATATGGTFNGNKTLTDATGSMTLRTLSTADFANDALPATCQNWTGYISRFTTVNQIYIRSTADFTAGTSCPAPPPAGAGIALTTSPVTLNFDAIGTGLPTGVSVRTGATATALGATATYTPSNATGIWNKTAGGFKNFASATGLTSTTDSTTQADATNRALGLRQVSATDKEVAFVFLLDNTTGKNNFAIEFLLQSLDPAVTRTVTWSVDYGLGETPTSFTTVATTGTVTTGPVFSSNTVTASFGSALNNQSGKVWIRIVALGASTGTGNRPSTAVDNFKITWN